MKNSYLNNLSKVIYFVLLVAMVPLLAAADNKYTCPMHPHYIADEMGSCPICGMDLVALETGEDTSANAQEKAPADHDHKAAEAENKYTCPMHPHYIADEMGSCPICGMDLVALETGEDTSANAQEKAPADHDHKAAEADNKYTCPMHPHYIADEMGSCPICGMDLVPLETGDDAAATGQEKAPAEHDHKAAEADNKYTCPMHPHYIADEMGSCPICGMDLVPMESDKEKPASEKEAKIPQRATISIPPETIQNMGVRYGRVEKTLFGHRIRAYGIVAENERQRREVSSRLAGWVEKLGVNAVGDPVKRGMRLYSLFSPDLVAAQRDYLSALERNGEARIRSAESRLKALGVSDSVIKRLRKNRKVVEQLPFHADAAGTVSELRVREGAYVRPGETLAVIQDYSTVWINAAVAEKDLPQIGPDTAVEVLLPSLPGQIFHSRVDYIYPTVDADSRTGSVRLVLDNPDGQLRPGSYADVLFEVGINRRLAVPDSALLMASDGHYVVVALGNGRFQARKVRTGISSAGFTEIVDGLEEGAKIVTSGQFLIDSESSLRESFQKLQRLKQDLSDLDLSSQQLAMLDHLVDAALYIHEGLIKDRDLDPEQLQPAREIRDLLWPAFGQTRLGPILDSATQAVAAAQQARTRSALRDALGQLVQSLKPWLLQGRPDHYREKGVKLYRDTDSHRLWLQLGDEPANPYGDSAPELLEGEAHDH